MLGQSTFNLKSRILDCFDFLQKSRNDEVGGIVIAIRFAFCAVITRQIVDLLNQSKLSVIARFGKAKSWQSIARALPEAIQKIKNFCYFLLSQKVESLYPIDSNPQSEILLIRSWLIYFTHCLKTRALDTSLHCVPLSMTNHPHSVILRALARSIHFGDFRILCDSRTLSESVRLNFIRFARFALFGLLRQIYDSPRNDKLRQSTPYTTFKGIKMQT